MINYFQVGLYFRIMKIKDLDRNEVYGLEEIKKDAVKFEMLKKWLKENDKYWSERDLSFLNKQNSINFCKDRDVWVFFKKTPTKCALTLFDLDITDYQVDCSELSKEQIGKLCDIFKLTGRKLINTKDDLEVGNKYKYFRTYYNDFGIFELSSNREIITYDKLIELFGEKILKENKSGFEKENQGYKETDNKCNYELDFNFIEQLAMRIQNEPKYEPYNWQKPMDVEKLSNAMLRHAIEVKKGNFDDNGELGHLLAIAANAMFIYHQKKNNDRGI